MNTNNPRICIDKILLYIPQLTTDVSLLSVVEFFIVSDVLF